MMSNSLKIFRRQAALILHVKSGQLVDDKFLSAHHLIFFIHQKKNILVIQIFPNISAGPPMTLPTKFTKPIQYLH